MYYYVASCLNDEIKVLRSSNEKEFNEIKDLQASLRNIIIQNNRLSIENKAFKRISNINKSLLVKKSEYNRDDLNHAISEYLFSFRKFLDNWETHIKREYGKDSDLYDLFKKSTAKAYDQNIEYRIVYQLRNADQHCDGVVTSISMGIDNDGARYIEATAKTAYLLSVYKKWKSSEKQYLSEIDRIDIFKLLNVTHRCIQQIHFELLNFFVSENLYDECCAIIERANEHFTDRLGLSFLCQPEALTKEFWAQPQKTLNNHSWMVRESINLLRVYFRKNLSVVSVLYYGNKYPDIIREIASELTEEEREKIDLGALVDIEGTKYRCYQITIDVSNDSSIFITINNEVPRDQRKIICNRFLRYVEALIGTKKIISHLT